MEQNKNIIAFPERRQGVRIADLRSWHYLQVTCRHCGHAGRVYPARLWRRYPMEARVIDIVRRFRCRECGGRGVVKWDIWQIDRNA
jgi:DNA-directed RNA polymerase subunit RPC12/RpoP